MVPSDDEWEYQYHENETETFLVDVDLSSLNGVIKHKSISNRKSLQVPTQNEDAEADAEPEEPLFLDVQADADPGPGDVGEGNDTLSAATTTLQILDFDTHNPIISHQNQVYSCQWSDMIGTNMFFSEQHTNSDTEPLRSWGNHDLVGMSRIRLIGHKARLVEKKSRVNKIGGKSLGNIRASNPQVNQDIKRQASFLEKLMDAKRAKGHRDNVRTYVSRNTKIGNSERPNRAGDSHSASREDNMRREIDELNRRVVRGDADALNRLEEIMSQSEVLADSNMDIDTSADHNPAGPSYPDPIHHQISAISSSQHPSGAENPDAPEHHDEDNTG